MNDISLMEKIISLCKRRGFIFPGSEIYGGLANSWDYGPLGVELKNNIKQMWWDRFVRRRSDIFGLDAALIMNTRVWEASGHVATFHDPLVECKKCHTRFRADDFVEEQLKIKTYGLDTAALDKLIKDNTSSLFSLSNAIPSSNIPIINQTLKSGLGV